MDAATAVRGMVIDEPYDPGQANAATLELEFAWLGRAIEGAIATGAGPRVDEPPPSLEGDESMYATFVRHYDMSAAERLTVLLALAPHARPHMLDPLFATNPRTGRGHTDAGGIQGRMHGGFLPTGETALFLITGGDLGRRIACQHLFERDHYFARHGILRLEQPSAHEPVLSGQLVLADEIVDLLTRGELRKPDFSRDFPARLIRSDLEWDDLVLTPDTKEQIRELEAWIRYEHVLMNDCAVGRRLRPGYRCLFHGPSGTGKTVTATLIGKRLGRDVYRVALSSVVSKYIGETEKNLERIFGRAENMRCILFFDEADALFGKRTGVSDAHDRYANQEVSYLLQRVEDFAGVVILASNFVGNIDEAFMRRFQAVVHFPMPNAAERLQLWRASFAEALPLASPADLDHVAERYELSGGAIMNVVRYASLMTLAAGSAEIASADIAAGVRRELHKDGKTL